LTDKVQQNYAGQFAAVIRDQTGALSDLVRGSRLEIYRQKENSWETLDSVLFEPFGNLKPPQLRQALNNLVERLEPVKIAIGRAFAGLFYQTLSNAGITLLQMEEFSPECLTELLSVLDEPAEVQAALEPTENEPGSGQFSIDLTAALAFAPDLSSKKILIPFLNNTPFLELKVYFDHLPPWLPADLEIRGLNWDCSNFQTGIVLTITPRCLTCS
jgi:hypothetical protein